jgi:hypothetical protein
VVPKTDKDGDELFFSAVLEKPIRRWDCQDTYWPMSVSKW